MAQTMYAHMNKKIKDKICKSKKKKKRKTTFQINGA
jgi:hypothetical protein